MSLGPEVSGHCRCCWTSCPRCGCPVGAPPRKFTGSVRDGTFRLDNDGLTVDLTVPFTVTKVKGGEVHIEFEGHLIVVREHDHVYLHVPHRFSVAPG